MIGGKDVILSRVNLCKSCSLEKENAELRERITDLSKQPLYDGYSLQKENARLSKMLEMAMADALSQSHYAECNGSVYGLNCSNIEEYRAKLEKRVENEK